MRNIKTIIVLLFLSSVLFSCSDDLLDKTPKENLSPDTFYENETQALMALTGIYNELQPNATPMHFYQFDFMSDNGYCHHSWQGSLEIGAWLTTSDSWGPSAKWGMDYSIIARANQFLSDIQSASIDEDVMNQMIAEAKFLRAYAYSDLISYFGDVPLILEPQSLDEAYVSRDAKSEVLTAIISDFDDAASVLPKTQSLVGRATKGAALAYKAKILLYNEEWADAAAAAKEVMDLDVYDLFSDFAGTFQEANENNVEVIFDIQYIATTQSQPWPSCALNLSEWPTANVTADLINSFYTTKGLSITEDPDYDDQDPYANRDPRLAASVILPGTSFGSSTFIPDDDEVPCGARPRKYAEENAADRYNISLNTILMRYADVLLMRAEALIENGSTNQEIYDLINEVRARVEMPTVESVEGTGLSQEDLRSIVRHERRVEFYNEGTRYADMLRWQDESLIHDVYGYDKSLLSDPSSASTWTFSQIKIATRTFDSDKGWLWPIPQSDIDKNENLLPNNPGY